jgi:ABC-type amino acid transport substrate-binding protein
MIPFGCSFIITFGLWSSANIKRMTMLICILILIVVVLSVPCLAQTENTSRPKTIVFGGRVNAAPFSFWDGSHWRGYTIELCNKIFDQYKEALGDEDLELEILPVTAANRFMALKENRIQALCGATTITISRKRDYNFTLMTYLSGASIMKRRGTKVEKLILAKDQHKKI